MHKGVTILTTLVVAGILALPARAQEAPSPETVVATVNGTDITLGHVIVAYNNLPQQYQQLEPAVLLPGIIDQLISQTALAQSFEDEPSRAALLSLENEERSLMAAEAIEQVMQQAAPEEGVRARYDERYANFSGEEEFNASHILVETQEEAQAIVEELAAGADFPAVAVEKSTGPSGPGGGELGWFGAGRMVPDFEAAVIALDVGQVSDPVETQFGWHVIKLNDKRVQNAPSFEDVREDIALELRQEAVSTHVERLVAASEVARPDLSNLDPSFISNIDLLSD